MNKMGNRKHSHPCNFRLVKSRDNGWGEMAFAYCWDSTSGQCGEPGYNLPDLAHCVLFEVTTYSGNVGSYTEGWYYPPNPPFPGWKLRDPTDGRTAPVGMECFPASNARAWDRHKRAGRLQIPEPHTAPFVLLAEQTYWFQCELCGAEEPLCLPHLIERRFEPLSTTNEGDAVWRYSLRKHNAEAWLDISRAGYVADSAKLGFGPWDGEI